MSLQPAALGGLEDRWGLPSGSLPDKLKGVQRGTWKHSRSPGGMWLLCSRKEKPGLASPCGFQAPPASLQDGQDCSAEGEPGSPGWAGAVRSHPAPGPWLHRAHRRSLEDRPGPAIIGTGCAKLDCKQLSVCQGCLLRSHTSRGCL